MSTKTQEQLQDEQDNRSTLDNAGHPAGPPQVGDAVSYIEKGGATGATVTEVTDAPTTVKLRTGAGQEVEAAFEPSGKKTGTWCWPDTL